MARSTGSIRKWTERFERKEITGERTLKYLCHFGWTKWNIPVVWLVAVYYWPRMKHSAHIWIIERRGWSKQNTFWLAQTKVMKTVYLTTLLTFVVRECIISSKFNVSVIIENRTIYSGLVRLKYKNTNTKYTYVSSCLISDIQDRHVCIL